MRRGLIAATASVVALLSVTVPAVAEKLTGATSQRGGSVSLRTNGQDELARLKIDWRAPCRFGGTIRSTTRFVQPYDRNEPGSFRDAGPYRASRGGYEVRHRTRIEGELDHGAFHGSFKISARYTKRGKYFSTCRSGPVRWFVRDRCGRS